MTNSTSGKRVADDVARAIARSGTTWAFGLPGGEVVVLIDALQQAGIRFVLAHHETEAAFMAAGYAELTGRPGVCVSTLGPGATNLVTGVASALLERAPIVALTGALAASSPHGATHQDLRLTEMFGPITKCSTNLAGCDAGRVTADAIEIALDERPGPVHLSLAADIAASPAERSTPTASKAGVVLRNKRAEEARDAALVADRARAASLLQRSRRPVLVVGLTAARQHVESSVARLADLLAAPVVVTPKAKGVISESHPMFLGVIDMAGDPEIGATLDSADLLIAIGCDVVEFDRCWTWAAPVLHVDNRPNDEGYYRSEVNLVAPLEASLAWLAESARTSVWSIDEIASRRRAVLDFACPPGARLQPWEVVEGVRAATDEATIAVSDVGAHKMVVGQVWRPGRPRSFFMANGLSSMGYSIPTGIAAKLAEPSRFVVSFVGDGGILMYLGELETITRLSVDMLIVVFADQSLELIRRAELKRGVWTGSATFANPDFMKLGDAFGIPVFPAATRAELDKALSGARAVKGPRLLVASIDGADYRL